jgi:branched-chain amino acid transport system permease protein
MSTSTALRSPRVRRGVSATAIGLAAVLVPAMSGDYYMSIATSVATSAILGLGLTVVLGYAGLLDLGYAAFFAIGAYTSAILTTEAGFTFWTALPVAAAAAGLMGLVVGVPTLRLRPDYLAIVTLGFGEITRISLNNWDAVGGPNGVLGIPPISIGGRELLTAADNYWMAVALLGVVLALTTIVLRSHLGRGWLAVGQDPFASETMGVPTLRLKLLAYVSGGVLAGVAGAFFAARLGIVSPESFTVGVSIQVLLIVVIGGSGSPIGALVGAAIVVGAPELLRVADSARILIFAVLLIVVVRLKPNGLVPRHRRRLSAATGVTDGAPVIARADDVPPGAPALELRSVTKSFGGVSALKDVSFAVAAGSITSLIGPNGAGKTTLINCVLGVSGIQTGSVCVLGGDVTGESPHRIAMRGVGRTFQGTRLMSDQSVLENVAIGAFGRDGIHLARAVLRPRAEQRHEQQTLNEAQCWLDFVGIGHLAQRDADELAYADRRRVEIARALAGHPRLLLLDEPAAGMNPTERAELKRLLYAINDLGITVLLVEHDIPLVLSISDDVIVLDQGDVICHGAPGLVQRDARVVEAYLGEAGPAEPAGGPVEVLA